MPANPFNKHSVEEEREFKVLLIITQQRIQDAKDDDEFNEEMIAHHMGINEDLESATHIEPRDRLD